MMETRRNADFAWHLFRVAQIDTAIELRELTTGKCMDVSPSGRFVSLVVSHHFTSTMASAIWALVWSAGRRWGSTAGWA
jgi:hypothetical protein